MAGRNYRDTSRTAYRRSRFVQGESRRVIVAAINRAANDGETGRACHEMHDLAKHESCSAALNALMNEGIIRDSGERRRVPGTNNPAIVWEPAIGKGSTSGAKQGALL